MSKKKRTGKKGWRSLAAAAKRLNAKLQTITALAELLPKDIASDPKALMEWLLHHDRRKGKGALTRNRNKNADGEPKEMM